MYQSFTEMPVYQSALTYSTQVFKISSSLPRSEDYGLTSQIRRSSNSVCANIAEAFGRKSQKDKAIFYVYARGSVYETQSHLVYGEKVEYFKNDEINKLIENYNELILSLNKIIKTLSNPSQP